MIMSRWIRLTVALCGVFFLGACVTNPETGRRSFNVIPDATLEAMGAQAYQEVLASEPRSRDARLTVIVQRVADRIAAASGKNFQWEVNLIDNPQANAFVLPGGKIIVYTGILPICETESGLAFVMGHEVGHAVAEHGGERMTQTLLIQSGLAVADLTLGDSAQKPFIMGAVGMGAQYGVLMPFSRSHESDADHMGIRYMARAGYDPSVAPEIWRRMGRGGQQPPEFLSTHPSHETRTARLEELMNEAQEIYGNAATKYGAGERLY